MSDCQLRKVPLHRRRYCHQLFALRILLTFLFKSWPNEVGYDADISLQLYTGLGLW